MLVRVSGQDSLRSCASHYATVSQESRVSVRRRSVIPARALPLLLRGPTGTEKFLARQLWQYAIEQGIFAPGASALLNCAEYANNPELLTSKLFGHAKGALPALRQERYPLPETSKWRRIVYR